MSPISAALHQRLEDARSDGCLHLNLSRLGLRAVPVLPVELRRIRTLNLSSNRLQEFPPAVQDLASLEGLDLGNNHLLQLPGSLGDFENLKCLDVSENRLTLLPAELGRCRSLRELHLYKNALTSLLPVDASFEQLEHLDASRNRLQSVSQIDGLSPNVRSVDLSGNQLQSLPSGIDCLHRLEVLDLSGNRLTSVTELAGMPALRELYLDNNLLRDVPQELAGLPTLVVLSLDGNSFGKLPDGFHKAMAAELRREVRAAVRANTSGGKEPGVANVAPPQLFFDFMLAIGGVASLLKVIDLYYKSFVAVAAAVVRFPDGRTIELNQISRKTAIQLVRDEEAPLRTGQVFLQVQPAVGKKPATSFLEHAVTRLPYVELVPKTADKPAVQFINYNLIVNSQFRQVVSMGDSINIGSITGSNVNIKSNLEHVQQAVGGAALDPSIKDELNGLIRRLAAALEQTPAEQMTEAEAVSDAAGDLVDKALKEKPNKKSIEISANGLLEAAKGIAAVLPIATDIVKTVTRLVTG
jgi:hypothetical protein